MSFDIAQTLRSGAERATARNGLLAFGLLFAFRLVDAVVNDSFTERFFVDVLEYELILADLRAQANQPIQDPLVGEFPFAVIDLPVSVLGALALTLFVVGVVVRIGIIRTFTSEETESLPTENFTRRLVWTLLNLIIGAIMYFVAVAVGFVLFVVPGIYIAVALFFYNYEIIVAEKGVIDAFSGSLDLTANNRLPLFLLGLIFVVLGAVASNLVGVALPGTTVAGATVQTLSNAAVAVFGIAVAAQAYTQLRSRQQEPRVE
ncbi:hypothetical protein [Salinibaculum rarum]|uniref:hypothetical protein n=1 Tax=Salinibaculum rarum TaxID=3058903 RepID=UPI00265E9C1E|nr:hypothetical protein [Salinibaculum sp. KK48]